MAPVTLLKKPGLDMTDNDPTPPRIVGAWPDDRDGLATTSLTGPAPPTGPMATFPCPLCGGALLPSRTRWYERVRRFFTPRRPYRCQHCEARSWR